MRERLSKKRIRKLLRQKHDAERQCASRMHLLKRDRQFMRCTILHESKHRIRIRCFPTLLTMQEADILEYYLLDKNFIQKVKVHERTGDAMITFAGKKERDEVVKALAEFSFSDRKAMALVPDHTGRALNHQYEDKLWGLVLGRAFRMVFFPSPLQIAWTVCESVRFIWRGIRTLAGGKLEVPVLDAAAITASMVRGDFGTAGSVMFLLSLGDLLEEWTHRKSVDDLARSMSLKVDRVWLKTEAEDVQVPISKVKPGDRIVIRTSEVIPLDGKVLEGEMTVNQSSMTGESVPVVKQPGGYVYAGTVVEEGECTVEVTKASGTGKYDQIVRMIEDSEKLKSTTETKAYHMADRLVPYSLGGTALSWLITRDVNRALSFLMVDFSCALKLSMPLAVLSALREAGEADISVKGGKFMESAADAKTIVFDKTGTLTHAEPKLVKIVTFDGADETDVLKIAACLEEHYPHSVANAVVEEAERRKIKHREMHTKVQYVVAHGIASMIGDEKVVIGSAHFVFEDEGCTMNEEERGKFDAIPAEYSHLYLAYGGKLKAVLCIFDPVREEVPDVIDRLHHLGIDRICMMTGDSERTAAAVARSLNIDEYHAEVLPEDKAAFIRKEHEAGRKVIMVGDGINDTPALSESDCGIAISAGAAIAQEVADVTIKADDLYRLVFLRQLSMALMRRINRNYRTIISFNMLLIALGVAGILPPSSSALLHNTSTILIGLSSMTDLLKKEDRNK